MSASDGKPTRKKAARKKAARNRKGNAVSQRLQPVYGADVEARILERVRYHGRITQAAEEVGLESSTIRHWLNPNHKSYRPHFAERYEVALDSYRDWLEAEVERRAVRGWVEPVYGREGLLGHVRKYSDRLLELHVKRHRPEYRDRQVVEHQHTGAIGALAPEIRNLIDSLDDEGRRALRVVLRQFEERRREAESAQAELREAQRLELEAGGDAIDVDFTEERDVMAQPRFPGQDRERNPLKDPPDPRDVEALAGSYEEGEPTDPKDVV